MEDLLAIQAQTRTASESVAAALKKQELDKAKVKAALASSKQQNLVLKLQSGFRGFLGRKNVWSLRNGGRPLDHKDMSTGLGQLGRSPASTLGRNHTYLSFTLRYEKINDIGLLAKYPLLTTVDLTHNNIPTLEALSVMPYLWKVRAGRRREEGGGAAAAAWCRAGSPRGARLSRHVVSGWAAAWCRAGPPRSIGLGSSRRAASTPPSVRLSASPR